MNLHSDIMNIQTKKVQEIQAIKEGGSSPILMYRQGHRDARHAAAEVSLKAEARIEELEEEMKKARQLLLNGVNPFASKMTAQEIHTAILNFLQEKK